MSKYLYLLDPGHGFNTKKKESVIWKDGTQLREYQFTRSVVKFLSFMLRENNIDFEILVTELKDISLKERVKRANELGKHRESILISIHGNQFTSEKVHGFETHFYKAGEKIAEVLQKHIGTLGRNRGVKKSNFYIIKNSSMPAILTENGFYSNELESKKMLTPDFQYKIAMKHFEAILEIETKT